MKKYWLTITLILIILKSGFSQIPIAPPNPQPDPRFKTDILLIVAHPDDETAMGSYLAKAIYDLNKKVAIIYLNRGVGGGNTAGNEQSKAMAAIREIEVRKATATLGIDLIWFLDGVDTPGQDVFHSLTNWGHGQNLEQVVRLVRLTRPEVIITWLPHYVAGENHGDHQAAGVLAVEAFDMAGNPTVFPAQVVAPRERTDINNFTEGLQPWQPKKLYFFSDASHPIQADGPSFSVKEISPSQKVPYYQLALKLHLLHLTQGDVAEVAVRAKQSGDYSEFVKWISQFKLIFGKSVVPCKSTDDVFQGIQPCAIPFVPMKGYLPHKGNGLALELGGAFVYYREFWRAHEIEHIGSIVEPEVMINTGGYLHIPLLLRNDTSDSIKVKLRAEYPDGWSEVAGAAIYILAPGEAYPVQTFFFAPNELRKEVQEIVWTATVKDTIVGSVKMNVYLSEWTLPQ
jgi:LmbE family N-acetylglucosaminyl deacetylase